MILAQKKKNVPVLRFPEFEREWERKTINDLISQKILAKPLDGNHGNIHPKSSDYVNNGIPFIMANDIKDGKINFHSCKRIRKTQAEKLQKGFAKEGDVLLTHKATIGETTIVPKLNDDYIVLTPQVTYYRIINPKKYYNKFLYQVFRTKEFIESMKVKAGGAGGVRLYIGITEQRNLSLPFLSIIEQQKIADFLSAVDERIQQLTRKKELLEQYKKGVMQQLFSQQIRFKDDNGDDYPDWEEKKIDQIFEITRGKVLSADKISVSPIHDYSYPVYSSQTKNKGLFGYYNQFLFEDSITWTTDGANAGEVNFRTGKFYCTNVCGVLISHKGYSNLCISEIINSVSKKHVSYVGNPKLMNNVMSKISISIPSDMEEQQKIAGFLRGLDDKISTVQTEIEQTQQFKKGLLQQMFA